MRLLIKFNLILILVFGAGIGITGYISRTYTSPQIRPVLQGSRQTFLPQTVPAFSATEAFNYLRSSFPDYTYKRGNSESH